MLWFEESSGNMKTKYYQWSGSFLKQGMGPDNSREVSGTCKHLDAKLIGGCKGEKKDSLPFILMNHL